jgi:large subunit ribosomal protein L10e
MASLRKASAYSKKKNRPYTRVSKNKSKSYIKQNPHNKIVKYNLGNKEAYAQGKFKKTISLISEEDVLIRDNAIEAGRLILNKNLERKIPKQFYLWIKIFPHHILRNNKTASGAGADRLSSGMKHSFGVIEGRAARVKKGKEIFVIATENDQNLKIARGIMKMVKAKMPCRTKVVIEN